MVTPGVFGYGPEAMSGLSYYGSIGYSIGPGGVGGIGMYCVKNMGVGRSSGFKIPVWKAFGAYRGVSYLFGWSTNVDGLP